jgi:hypothetical protein
MRLNMPTGFSGNAASSGQPDDVTGRQTRLAGWLRRQHFIDPAASHKADPGCVKGANQLLAPLRDFVGFRCRPRLRGWLRIGRAVRSLAAGDHRHCGGKRQQGQLVRSSHWNLSGFRLGEE